MKRIHVLIYGKVQGVGFRFFIDKLAYSLGIKGYVKNSNNQLEAEFEGKEESIEKILEYCRKGPAFAKVTKIEVKDIQLKNEDNFEVK